MGSIHEIGNSDENGPTKPLLAPTLLLGIKTATWGLYVHNPVRRERAMLRVACTMLGCTIMTVEQVLLQHESDVVGILVRGPRRPLFNLWGGVSCISLSQKFDGLAIQSSGHYDRSNIWPEE